MADAQTELKIVVRAVDAATSVINGIGRKITGLLLAPLKLVANAVRGIFKQFFSLKGLLIGGGIIGVIRSLSEGLAKNAKEFEPVFGKATQDKIDATATAFNKLGASLKKTFAEIIVEFKLDEKLNMLSDWLRDNQAGIIKFFRDMTDGISRAAAAALALLGSLRSVKAATVGGDTDGLPVNPADDDYLQRKRRLERLRNAQANPGAMSDAFDSFASSRPSSRPSDDEPDPVDTAFDKLRAWEAANGRVITIMPLAAKATEGFGKAQEIVGEKTEGATAALSTHHGTLTQHIEQVERAIIATEEYADTIAGNFTDAFFDAIEGTKTFARAFADMTVSILRDIGRLLVFRSIFNLVAGALTPSIAGPNAGNIGGAGEAGGTFGAGFEAPYGFAGGTRSARGGFATVGEQGPERVFLPRGSRVEPNHAASSGGGGITINVVGARDARATAREVVAELRRNGGLRAAVRTA